LVPSLIALLVLASVLAGALPGCGEPTLNSRWLDRTVTGDGNAAEWAGALFSLEENRLVVGFMNDGADLYVCLGSDDRAVQRQIMGSGMTLWIDPDGGKEKALGIRFPLHRAQPGLPPEGNPSDRPSPGDEPNPQGRSGSGHRFDLAALVRTLQDSTAELEIVHRDGPAERMTRAELKGIELRVGLKDETMAYELRIPLRHSDAHPLAVGAEPGQTIGLGLETPPFDRKRMPGMEGGEMGGDRSGAPPSGDGDWSGGDGGSGSGGDEGARPEGGRHGGMGGGMGGMHGGMRPGADRRASLSGPIKEWIKVELARGPSSATP